MSRRGGISPRDCGEGMNYILDSEDGTHKNIGTFVLQAERDVENYSNQGQYPKAYSTCLGHEGTVVIHICDA